MATAMKKTTKKVEEPVEVIETPVIEEEVTETKTTKKEKPAKKKFSADEEIECVSITPGQLFVKGERSKDLYTFADADDIQFIRFDDLDYLARRKHPSVYNPNFIIQDDDFLASYPDIKAMYDQMYTGADLRALLKLTPAQMKSKIAVLPIGAKDALKIIASTEVDAGRLDSVQKVKILDEIFGTDLLFRLTN